MSDYWSDPSSTSILHVCEQQRLWLNYTTESIIGYYRVCTESHTSVSSESNNYIFNMIFASVENLVTLSDEKKKKKTAYSKDPKFSDRQVWTDSVDLSTLFREGNSVGISQSSLRSSKNI